MKKSPLQNADGLSLDNCTLSELKAELRKVAGRLIGTTGTLADAKKMAAIQSQVALLETAMITAAKMAEEYRQSHP